MSPLQKLLNSQKPQASAPQGKPAVTANTTREPSNPPQAEGSRVNPLLALMAKPPAAKSQQGDSTENQGPTGNRAQPASSIPSAQGTGGILAKMAAKNLIPTASVEATKKASVESKAIAVVASAPSSKGHEEVDESAPLDMKSRLDELDRLIQRDNGISAFTFDAIRSHVKTIMIQMKEEPELDALLIDRDVRNILRFIRHIKVDALADQTKKVEKATTKAKKGGVGKIKFDMASALGNLDSELGGLKALGNLKL